MAPLKKITIFNDYYQNCSSYNYNEINIKYVIQLLHVNIVTIADYVKLYHGGGVKSFLSKMISQQFSFFKNQAVIDKARLFLLIRIWFHYFWIDLF